MDYYPREHSLAVIISNGDHHLTTKTCKWGALLIDITETNWIMMIGHHLSHRRWHTFLAWLIVPKSTLHCFAAFRGMFFREDNKGDGSWDALRRHLWGWAALMLQCHFGELQLLHCRHFPLGLVFRAALCFKVEKLEFLWESQSTGICLF